MSYSLSLYTRPAGPLRENQAVCMVVVVLYEDVNDEEKADFVQSYRP